MILVAEVYCGKTNKGAEMWVMYWKTNSKSFVTYWTSICANVYKNGIHSPAMFFITHHTEFLQSIPLSSAGNAGI